MFSIVTGGADTQGLNTRARDRSNMRDPVLVELLSYWERLRAGRVAPPRSELDPREILSALDHTFILDLTRMGDVRFRLSGMFLNTLMGMDLRGMPARSVIALDSRDQFDDILDDLLCEPKIVELRLAGRVGTPGQATGRMLLLPMVNDAGELTRVLGCLTVDGPRGEPPMRLSVEEVVTTRIVGAEIPVDPEPRQAGFAESAAPFEGPRRLSSEKPYLRLVRDED